MINRAAVYNLENLCSKGILCIKMDYRKQQVGILQVKKKDTSQQSKPDLYNPYRGQKQNEQMLEKCKADLK